MSVAVQVLAFVFSPTPGVWAVVVIVGIALMGVAWFALAVLAGVDAVAEYP